jgi:hypothetical protein
MSRLVDHVKQSPNYNRFQSAYPPYRHGHSTETALLRLLNDVYCVADSWLRIRTLLLQLDLSAALDTSTLLRRLRYTFGVSSPALNWIASYLVGLRCPARICTRPTAVWSEYVLSLLSGSTTLNMQTTLNFTSHSTMLKQC